MAEQTFLKKIASTLWAAFLNGLFTLLPIVLTISLVQFVLRMINAWLAPIRNLLPEALHAMPFAEVAVALLFVLVVGAVLKSLLLKQIVRSFERLFARIPLVSLVYAGIKQLVRAFTVQDAATFKEVVYIEFPRAGLYSIGFLTRELPQEISPQPDGHFYNVFIPTTPNPTTGYYVLVRKEQLIPINITRQEAMALIISGGIVQPERFTPDHDEAL